ncbi:hypothetical protein RB594_000256 [Gaeumannomyces avenae]
MNEQDRLNRLSPELLTPDVLAETLYIFDKAMRHTPYAVSGMSAYAAWGYTAKCPRHVSVVVPAYSKDTIRSWARTAGFDTFATRPDLLGVCTADGKFRRVRLRYIENPDDDGWGDFRSVRLPMFMPPALLARTAGGGGHDGGEGEVGGDEVATEATPVVLQLPTLFNLAAHTFMSDAARSSSGMRASIGRDILWMLERMSRRTPGEEGAGPLAPDAASMLKDAGFWREFTFAFPRAPALFATAGMGPALVGQMVAEAEGRPHRRPDHPHHHHHHHHHYHHQREQEQEQPPRPPPTPPKDAKWQAPPPPPPPPAAPRLPEGGNRASLPRRDGSYEPYRPGPETVLGFGRVTRSATAPATATRAQSPGVANNGRSSSAPGGGGGSSRYSGLSAVPAALLPCGGRSPAPAAAGGGDDWLADWSRALGREAPRKNDPESQRQRARQGIAPPPVGRRNPYRDE